MTESFDPRQLSQLTSLFHQLRAPEGFTTTPETPDVEGVFYIRLPKYNNMTWAFNKQVFMDMFPDSFISETLNVDPTANIIEIEQIVTPEVMQYLYNLTDEY